MTMRKGKFILAAFAGVATVAVIGFVFSPLKGLVSVRVPVDSRPALELRGPTAHAVARLAIGSEPVADQRTAQDAARSDSTEAGKNVAGIQNKETPQSPGFLRDWDMLRNKALLTAEERTKLSRESSIHVKQSLEFLGLTGTARTDGAALEHLLQREVAIEYIERYFEGLQENSEFQLEGSGREALLTYLKKCNRMIDGDRAGLDQAALGGCAKVALAARRNIPNFWKQYAAATGAENSLFITFVNKQHKQQFSEKFKDQNKG